MHLFIDDLVRLCMVDHPEVFGANVAFLEFEQTWEMSTIFDGTPFKFVTGFIKYESDAGRRASDPVLVKCVDLTMRPAELAEFGYKLFSREVFFFETVLPAFDRVHPIRRLMPKYYAGCATTSAFSNKGAILFQSLPGLGHFECKNLVYDVKMYRMVRDIAEFHACSFLVGRENPNFLTHPKLGPPRIRFDHVLPILRQSLEYIGGTSRDEMERATRLRNMVHNFEEHLNQAFSPDARNHCWVLCHQRYSKVNIIGEKSKCPPVIFNWHWMGVASLGVDLVIMLFVESNRNCRIALRDFIAEYHKTLRGFCGDLCPSEEDINAEVKRCVPFALYILADRIVSARAEREVVAPMFPATFWVESLLTDLYKFLIARRWI